MPDHKSPDFWYLLYEQTPLALRWAFGVLTLGIFTLSSALYRWRRDDLKQIHARVDRLERRMEVQHAETNRLLFEIAHNTRDS